MYNYFVSYAWQAENLLGFGRGNVQRDSEIVSLDDIAAIEDKISAEHDGWKVAIVQFRLFPVDERREQ